MKHRHVRGKLVALGRIMGAAQAVEPGQVDRRQLGSNNQRAGHSSLSSSLKGSAELAIK